MRAIERRSVTVLGATLAVVLTACGSAPPTTPVPSPSAAAATSAAPSSAASPSPSPGVTSSSLLARLGQPSFTLVADMTGTLTANQVTFPITGHLENGGGNSSFLMVVRMPTGEQRSESVTVDGTTWKRTIDGGPWVEDDSTGGKNLGGLVTALASLQDNGLTSFEGRTVHRFVTPPGALTATDLGISSPGITGLQATLALLADDSSDLVGMTLDASWKQAVAATSIDASMAVQFTLDDRAPSIAKPEEPWKRFDSPRYGMSVAYPATFQPDPGTGRVPDLLAYSKTDYAILAREPQPKGVTLAEYVKAYENSWNSVNRARPDGRTDGTMGSLPAVFLTYHMKLDGRRIYLVVGLTMQARNGYFVAVQSVPGNESNANGLFEQMMTTFQVTA